MGPAHLRTGRAPKQRPPRTKWLRAGLRTDADSKRIPGRMRRELQVADVDAEPRAHPRSDRYDDDSVRGQRGEAEPAHEIGRAVDAAEPPVYSAVTADCRPASLCGRRPRPRRSRATGPASRLSRRRVAGIHLAFAVTQAADESAGRLLAEDVAVGQPPAPPGLLNDFARTRDNPAEESWPLSTISSGEKFDGESARAGAATSVMNPAPPARQMLCVSFVTSAPPFLRPMRLVTEGFERRKSPPSRLFCGDLQAAASSVSLGCLGSPQATNAPFLSPAPPCRI